MNRSKSGSEWWSISQCFYSRYLMIATIFIIYRHDTVGVPLMEMWMRANYQVALSNLILHLLRPCSAQTSFDDLSAPAINRHLQSATASPPSLPSKAQPHHLLPSKNISIYYFFFSFLFFSDCLVPNIYNQSVFSASSFWCLFSCEEQRIIFAFSTIANTMNKTTDDQLYNRKKKRILIAQSEHVCERVYFDDEMKKRIR